MRRATSTILLVVIALLVAGIGPACASPSGDVCGGIPCVSTVDGGIVGDGGDAGGDDAFPTQDGSPMNDGSSDASSSDSSSDSSRDGSDASSGVRREFDLCVDDTECTTGLLCRVIFKGSPTRCTRRCASGCMSGTACVIVGADDICVWNDVGRPCTTASTCQFACLTAQQYCTNQCTDAHDCPNGYGCMAVSNTRVCVKAEAPCDSTNTSACIAMSACDLTTQMVVGGCTLACSSAADCPQRAAPLTPWTCDGGGICRRPADVFGPLDEQSDAEYACNASSVVVNVCNDAQHIDFTQFTIPSPPTVTCGATMTTPGVAGDKCVDSCRYQGGCKYGSACTALGSVNGARIGLCLPALGAGEVGDNCAIDGDCLFGYCNRVSGKCSRDCSRDGVCPTGSSCVAAGGPMVEGFAFSRCQ
jgi:hypothetical protein